MYSLQVELHVHFDGAGRAETLWEAIKLKDKSLLPGDGSLNAFIRAFTVQKPRDLGHFLSGFGVFCPAYM